MAIRRMFHGRVVQSKAFLALSREAQLLYFHMGMLADEDGFVVDAEIMRCRLGLGEGALKELIDNNFLLDFGETVVIRHFLVANTLKNDRLKPFQFPEIAKKIYVKTDRTLSVKRSQGAVLLTTFKRRLGKTVGIQSDSLNRNRNLNRNPNPNQNQNRNQNCEHEQELPPLEAEPEDAHDRGDQFKIMGGVLGQGVIRLTDDQMEALMDKLGLEGFHYYVKRLSDFIIENHATVRNHYATICKWWEEDKSYGEKFEPVSGV